MMNEPSATVKLVPCGIPEPFDGSAAGNVYRTA